MIDTSDSDAYWRKRIYDFLMQVGKLPHAKLLTFWNEILDDMYLLVTATTDKIADVSKLNTQVNEKIKDSNMPKGSPGLTIDPKTNLAIYYQALIKK